jgi:SAM-dependent methyltransferase
MSRTSRQGFVIRRRSGFTVDYRFVSAESYLATDRLVREIAALRHAISGRMLDIGCGSKPYHPMFRESVSHHLGVDLPTSLHDCSAVEAFAGATWLPFRAGAFDCVLCTEVLEHVPQPEQAIAEIARVLRPGGRAIITTPFMYRVHEAPFDFFRYTPFALRSLAERAGLQVAALRTRGGYLTVACDLTFKGLAVMVSALNALVRRLLPGRRHLLHNPFIKFLFCVLQWLPALLLRRENLKSDIYTLGYVMLLHKPDLNDPVG